MPTTDLREAPPWPQWIQPVAEQQLSPIDIADSGEDSFTYLRQFAPEVIKTLEFRGDDASGDLLAAIDILRELYVRGGRNVPAGSPTSFVLARWQGYLSAGQEARTSSPTGITESCACCSRCVTAAVRRRVGARLPPVRRSTTILMPAEEWEQVRAEYCALVGVPATADEALAQAEEQLRAALLGLVELLPRLTIIELLIEVDRWTGFSDKLTHAGDKSTRDDALLRQIYAAVLVQACNFGITAVAESTGLTCDKLAWTTQ